MRTGVLSGLLLVVLAAGVQAEELTGRLKRIAETGEVVIAHRENSVPFAYYDNKGLPVGYGMDIAHAIVAKVRERLNRPDLRVRYNPTTPGTRFTLMVNNVTDMECGATTHNKAREKLADFSLTYYIGSMRIATRKDSGIKDFADLVGKRVAVSANTTAEPVVRGLAPNMQVLVGRNNTRAMQMVDDGRADAFVNEYSLVAGEIAQLANADEFHMVGTPRNKEAFACMLPLADPQFRAVANEAIAGLMQSGALQRSYQRWFEAPIPPRGGVLRMPLSDEMSSLFAAPNDEIIQ